MSSPPPTLKWGFYTVSPRPGAPTVNSYEGACIRLRVLANTQAWSPWREVGYVGPIFGVNRADPYGAAPKFRGYGFWIHGASGHGIPNLDLRDDVPLATLDAAKEEATTYMNRYMLHPDLPAPMPLE